MYKTGSFNGADLPEKTLCLTFDDGPGLISAAIGRFLADNQIVATFFVVGKYAVAYPEVLQELRNQRHIIANHTFEHPDLPYYQSRNGDVLNQVLRTDAAISIYNDKNSTYFRAPYGKWSAEVAASLNQSIYTLNHIGPIHWDVAGIDCYYWQNNWELQEAVNWYVNEIDKRGKGIIVFHDDIADMETVKSKNQTLDLIKLLIPILIEKGYRFAGLDEVPAIKEASNQNSRFKLQIGRLLGVDGNGLVKNIKAAASETDFELENLGFGKIAIKTTSGKFWTAAEANQLTANAIVIGDYEKFDIIPVDNQKFMLRCYTGNYISIKRGVVNTEASFMRQAAIISYVHDGPKVQKQFNMQHRLMLAQKRLLFLRSKVKEKVSRLH